MKLFLFVLTNWGETFQENERQRFCSSPCHVGALREIETVGIRVKEARKWSARFYPDKLMLWAPLLMAFYDKSKRFLGHSISNVEISSRILVIWSKFTECHLSCRKINCWFNHNFNTNGHVTWRSSVLVSYCRPVGWGDKLIFCCWLKPKMFGVCLKNCCEGDQNCWTFVSEPVTCIFLACDCRSQTCVLLGKGRSEWIRNKACGWSQTTCAHTKTPNCSSSQYFSTLVPVRYQEYSAQISIRQWCWHFPSINACIQVDRSTPGKTNGVLLVCVFLTNTLYQEKPFVICVKIAEWNRSSENGKFSSAVRFGNLWGFSQHVSELFKCL